MASFTTPSVTVNQVGWGPTDLPERFVMLPFNSFSKSDRLGRAADFAMKDPRYNKNRWRNNNDIDASGNAEDEFIQVEDPNKNTLNRNKGSRGFTSTRGFRARWNRSKPRTYDANRNAEQERSQLLKGKQAKYLVQHTRRGKQFRGRARMVQNRRYNQRRDIPTLEASVKVLPSWRLIDTMELASLTRLKIPVPKATDLKWCGHVCRYVDSYERTSTRNISKLKRFPKVVFNNTSSIDDPVLQEYAQNYSGKGKVVLCTDELLSHLMASPRSVFPWDLVFTHFNTGIMFIDKRDDSGIEMLTVNETSKAVQQQDDKTEVAPCNTPDKLAIEATAINQNFSQQVVDKTKKKEFNNPNPLFDSEDEEPGSEPSSFAYRYREWDMEEYKVIARTEIHSYQRVTGKTGKKKNSYMTTFALNEADPRITQSFAWKTKIDSSRGSVLADGLKNNSCKVSKWTVQTLLAGADQMKVGFVQRKSPKDPFNHEIIGTQFYQPNDFANQINLYQTNCWAIFKNIVDQVYKEPAGKYVLLRDPNKPTLKIYEVPMDSFNDDDDDEEEDDYEEEDDEEYDA